MSNKKQKSGALPGAQEKYQATLTAEGRYVVNNDINLDPIRSWPLSVCEHVALDAARKEPSVPGPSSIVDRIIGDRKDEYQADCRSRRHAVESANASVGLSGMAVTDEMRRLQQKFIRGETTIDKVIIEVLANHQATVEMNKACKIFDKDELLTAEDICSRLTISPAELEAAVSRGDFYFVWGADDVLRYPGASANRIALMIASKRS